MRKILLNVLFIGGFCFTGVSYAIDAAEQLVKSLQDISTFKAHFVQKIKGADGDKLSKSQGDVVIARPGKFYWKSEKPNQMLVVADGKHVWTYDTDLEQVTKQDQKPAMQNSPATLLAGDVSKLAEDFAITYAKKCGKQETCYLLKPKQKDSTFSVITIIFSHDKLLEVRMRDPLGQNVYTAFTKVEVNRVVDQTLFAFAPPKGVDVIQAGS
jgi:outer membrane lipoprotein carrier protein